MKKGLLVFFCILIYKHDFGQTYYHLTSLSSSLTIDWSDPDLIATDNDWSSIPYIKGFRGDGLTSTPDVDPRTITADGMGTPSLVAANQTDPASFSGDGFAEFESLSNPTLAFKASNTANAPFLMFYIDTQNPANGFTPGINFLLRDIDASGNNSTQQIAVQYRVGETGPFLSASEFLVVFPNGSDYFGGYNPDVTTGPSLSGHVSFCEFIFPPSCLNQPKVQVRIIMTNATGGNEWIGIDDIHFGGGQLLPVKYNSFSAEAKNSIVQLKWNCITESMVDQFEIERSINGSQYNKIATVFAKGEGSFDYNYTDATPYNGTSFYRLKLINSKGGFSYTNIETVKWSRKDIFVDGLFPNPAHNLANLKITVNKSYSALLQIENVQGMVIKKQSIRLNAGNNNIPVQAGNLSAGNYIVRININNEIFTERFVKQ